MFLVIIKQMAFGIVSRASKQVIRKQSGVSNGLPAIILSHPVVLMAGSAFGRKERNARR